MKLCTINTDEELDHALDEVGKFFVSPPVPGSEEARRFDDLAEVIAAFEDQAYPIYGA